MVAALPRRTETLHLADPELRGHYVRVPPQGPACSPPSRASRMASRSGPRSAPPTCLRLSRPATRRARPSSASRKGCQPSNRRRCSPTAWRTSARAGSSATSRPRGCAPAGELKRVLEKYVLPHWRDRAFADIRRSDVAALLDAVEDKHGPWVADEVLAVLGSVSTWFASRNDDYVPPFVKGMRRVPAQARKRSRILSDAELRAVWRAAEAGWRLRCLPPAVAVDGAAPREGRDHEVVGPRRRRLDHRQRAAREGQPRRVAVAAAGHEGHRAAAAPWRQPVCLSPAAARGRWPVIRSASAFSGRLRRRADGHCTICARTARS